MSTVFSGHFDGKVIIPDEAVSLPVGEKLRLRRNRGCQSGSCWGGTVRRSSTVCSRFARLAGRPIHTAAKMTKKLLVAFDSTRTAPVRGDFVVPVCEAGTATFFGLRSREIAALGLMVYVGKEVTVNDLFAKLVDTGHTIPNVDQAVGILTDYVARLSEHKIGNVLAIEPAAEETSGFRLKKIANTPSGISRTT